MLNFAVFDPDGTPTKAFPIKHAHLFGADDLAFQATIAAEPGLIRCQKNSPETAGLCVQFEVPAQTGVAGGASLGLLTLQTCLLPERDEPYLLSLELARHRIMLFLNKLEEWGMTDLSSDDPVMAEFEQARLVFTEALVADRPNHSRTHMAPGEVCPRGKADLLALRALALAIDAGEKLAARHAERQVPRRLAGDLYRDAVHQYTKLTGDPPPQGASIAIPGSGTTVVPVQPSVGVAINPAVFSEAAQRVVSQCCDFITMPMRWADMEPAEGKYHFAPTDRWIEWAVRTARVPVVAGPILDLRPSAVPEFLYIWENDYETFREMVAEHVQQIVTRYRRTIARWTVASGLQVNSNFKFSFDQIVDLTKVCVMLVRKLHPTAKIQLEIDQPWGEYYARQRRSMPPLFYTETILQAGMPIDVVGLRVQMGLPNQGRSTRDLMAFSALLDRYAAFEKPLAVTAIGAPSQPLAPEAEDPAAEERGELQYPGRWRGEWSETTQSEWAARAAAIALSKPSVISVCWQELMDVPREARPEMAGGALMSQAGLPRAIAARLAGIRQALREGRPIV
ncbi:MAG: endo-1,4-beta-xylanase [Planctomycetota bacterium]|nr:endo-1,4-beta-xylanase [Planctomycetota bacterium]